MKYSYRFDKDPFGDIKIVLPEKISLFSDFIENITTIEQTDEYIEYIQNVLNGIHEDFEIDLNGISVLIKKMLQMLKTLFWSTTLIKTQ